MCIAANKKLALELVWEKNENVCAVFIQWNIHVINPYAKWKKTLINKNKDGEYFGKIEIWNMLINMMKYVYLGVLLCYSLKQSYMLVILYLCCYKNKKNFDFSI